MFMADNYANIKVDGPAATAAAGARADRLRKRHVESAVSHATP